METILFLTGCIKPNVTDNIAVSDWHERQKMYVEAVQWYIDNTPYRMLFVENSGTDISAYVNDPDRRVEFLTFDSPPTVPDRSRSYKEMEIMEYGWSRSKTLNRGGYDYLIIKITGRLKLLNVVKIATRLERYARRHAEHGIVSSAKNVTRPFSDCRYIYFTPQFMPILLAQKENVWPTYGMEWVLGDALREAKRQGIRFTFPPLLERTEGIGMTHGHDLSSAGLRLFKARIKHAVWKRLFDIGLFPLDGRHSRDPLPTSPTHTD